MFDNLRAEMRRYKKTNADIGEILGIASNTVSMKLNGKAPFTLDEIHKLARTFNCSLDYLATKHLQVDKDYEATNGDIEIEHVRLRNVAENHGASTKTASRGFSGQSKRRAAAPIKKKSEV